MTWPNLPSEHFQVFNGTLGFSNESRPSFGALRRINVLISIGLAVNLAFLRGRIGALPSIYFFEVLYLRRPEFSRYRVRVADFLVNHGETLLQYYYHSSPYELVSAVYDDFNFKRWLFGTVSKNFFEHLENRKDFVQWLVEKVGVTDASELRAHHFKENSGSGLLQKYGGSPGRVLDSLNSGSRVAASLARSTYRPANYWVCFDFPNLSFQSDVNEVSAILGFSFEPAKILGRGADGAGPSGWRTSCLVWCESQGRSRAWWRRPPAALQEQHVQDALYRLR